MNFFKKCKLKFDEISINLRIHTQISIILRYKDQSVLGSPLSLSFQKLFLLVLSPQNTIQHDKRAKHIFFQTKQYLCYVAAALCTEKYIYIFSPQGAINLGYKITLLEINSPFWVYLQQSLVWERYSQLWTLQIFDGHFGLPRAAPPCNQNTTILPFVSFHPLFMFL
jgi:hypothetical protein